MHSWRTVLAGIGVASILIAAPPTATKSILSVRDPNRFQTDPRIAVNTKTRQSLVVWEKHPGDHPGHSLQARLLNSQGKPAGPVFTVVSGPNTYHPDIAYNPLRNEYALLYANEFTSFGVFLQRLNPQGKPIGAAVRIPPGDEPVMRVSDDNPLVVFDQTTGNITVLWAKFKFSNSTSNIVEGIYGVVLNSSYSIVAGPTLILRSPVALADLRIHPQNGSLLLAYYQLSPGSFAGVPRYEYYAASLSPNLEEIQPSNILKVKAGVNASIQAFVEFAFLPSGTGFVIYSDNFGLRMRKLNLAGKFAGPAQPVFQAPLNNTHLFSVASADYHAAAGFRRVFFAVEDPKNSAGRRRLWIQVTDDLGKPSGPPQQVSLADFSSNLIAASIPVPVHSRNYRFVAVFEEGMQVLRPVNGESTQLVLVNLNLSLP